MRFPFSACALTLLGLMLGISAASAQQTDTVYTIGWLWIGRPDFVLRPMEKWTGRDAAFRDAMRDRGYVLGKNLVVVYRQAGGDVTKLAAEAEALVASKVDVIVAGGTPAA